MGFLRDVEGTEFMKRNYSILSEQLACLSLEGASCRLLWASGIFSEPKLWHWQCLKRLDIRFRDGHVSHSVSVSAHGISSLFIEPDQGNRTIKQDWISFLDLTFPMALTQIHITCDSTSILRDHLKLLRVPIAHPWLDTFHVQLDIGYAMKTLVRFHRDELPPLSTDTPEAILHECIRSEGVRALEEMGLLHDWTSSGDESSEDGGENEEDRLGEEDTSSGGYGSSSGYGSFEEDEWSEGDES
jgi:hypothetical protein